MQLEKAKQYAETFADQTVKDAVITVPAYFSQAERRAIMMAAELSGLNILQIMGDNAAGNNNICQTVKFFRTTVKPGLRGHSKRTPKIGFQDRLSLNAGQKYCRMLQESILQYF